MKKTHIEKMKNVGIVRKLDKLGRLSLPMEFRKLMGIGDNDPLETKLCKDENEEFVLIVRKYRED